jgi:hypothetical protein
MLVHTQQECQLVLAAAMVVARTRLTLTLLIVTLLTPTLLTLTLLSIVTTAMQPSQHLAPAPMAIPTSISVALLPPALI